MATRVAFRTCPLCEATCGLRLEVEDGRVTPHPRRRRRPVLAAGSSAPRARRWARCTRIPTASGDPLVRRNGAHVEASWEEAFAEVERRLAAVVDRSTAATPSPSTSATRTRTTSPTRSRSGRSSKALGTKNVYSASTVDQMPKHVACGLVFGHPLAIPVPDIDRTDLLLLLGANPLESNGSLATAPDWPGRLEAIRRRGGRVVVVDPRRTRQPSTPTCTCRFAPAPMPGLLAGSPHVLFAEELDDPGPLRRLGRRARPRGGGGGRLHARARVVVHRRPRPRRSSPSHVISPQRRRQSSTGGSAPTRRPTAPSPPGSWT